MRLLLVLQDRTRAQAMSRLIDAASADIALLDHVDSAPAAVRLLAAGHHHAAVVEERFFADPALAEAAAEANVPLLALLEEDGEEAPAGLDAAALCLPAAGLTARALAINLRHLQREAERRAGIRETQRLFDLAQETVGIGAWTWDLATQEVVWSHGMYRLFGVSAEHSHREPFKQWLAQVHPEDRDAVQSAAASAIAGHRLFDSTFRIFRPAPEGDVPELRWINSKGEISRDAANGSLRFIGINIDVTETHRALEAMTVSRREAMEDAQRSEQRFHTYFDVSPDCMFHLRVEADGRMTYEAVNPAGLAVTGLGLEHMRGRTPEEVLGPDKGGQMTVALHAALSSGQPYRYEPSWAFPGGTVTYDALYVPMRDAEGAVAGILGIARDITERRHLEASLQQAQKTEALGQLAGGVAHDFNNLLAGFGAAFVLLQREAASATGQRVLAEAQRSVERGRALTEWLLGFARARPPAPTQAALTPVLRNVESVIGRSLGAGIRVELDLAPDLWRARVDVNEFELAMLNLAINARDAMPMGGVLRIASRNETIQRPQPDGLEAGDYVVVDIADDGHGMAPDVLARVLEPYFTTKKAGQGTGLGLSMVASIARRSGGGVRISSSLGAGTEVSLYFPRIDAAEALDPGVTLDVARTA